ncbi:MAG: hypothetical protein QOJ65_1442, partial [Fimbriimonadaceae bacterium]|nr:hypothetical protein [Fimbriimonadaceae bacterium]
GRAAEFRRVGATHLRRETPLSLEGRREVPRNGKQPDTNVELMTWQ